jgi:hypothetical protein
MSPVMDLLVSLEAGGIEKVGAFVVEIMPTGYLHFTHVELLLL